MSELPFELPDAAYAWANLVEATLESEMEAESGDSRLTRDRWEEPDEPIWTVLVASELIDSADAMRAQVKGDPKARAHLERFLGSLIRAFRQAIWIDPGTDDLEHLKRLVLLQHIAQLYTRLHGCGLVRCEGAMLQVLFSSGHTTAIKVAVDLLLTRPPLDWEDVSVALAPLMQSNDWDLSNVFPRLATSTTPSVLAPALDIANYVVRRRSLDVHPVVSQSSTLITLLGGLAQQLAMLEENPSNFGTSVETIQKILFDSVSLCVSLCHTFGLLGDKNAIGKLNQVSQLAHRRIRTEAAFALAKLGEKKGEQQLIELAADFSSRQRAIAYAEELGIEDQVDEKWTTAAAVAESRLANWLAQNEQMGVSPARMELIDQRTLNWPGFEQPQECFLFRYEYDLRDSIYSNVGFSGPMCHTFSQDLADISIDDTYAIFVGHDIDHPDAYELPPNSIDARLVERSNRVAEALSDDISIVETLLCGSFFEHFGLLVRVTIHDELRVAVLSEDERVTYEPFTTKNKADPMLTYWLWRGRTFFETV
jgi:hypothetical protein